MKQGMLDGFREHYPEIFQRCRSLTCDYGWFDLLDRLCKQITDAVEAGGSQFHATQVKEKFGTLRFYGFGGDETTNALIDAAVAQSAHVCEQCGASPASMSAVGGIYRTRCAGCYSTLRKEQGPHVFDFCREEDIGPALVSHRHRVIEAFAGIFGLERVQKEWMAIEADQTPELVRQVRGVLGTLAKMVEEHAAKSKNDLADLQKRAERADVSKVLEILDQAPNIDPEEWDRL